MKTNNIFSIILILLVLLNSCTTDDQKGFPSVTTLPNAEVFDDGTIIHAEISQENAFEIIDHGVVYCIEKNSSKDENFEKISLGALTSGNTFSVLIDRYLLKNVTYLVKVYITTKEKTVYGNEITFVSKGGKAPVLNSFWPEKGFAGDTLLIRGQYFSGKNQYNKVYFSNLTAQVIYSTDSLLKVIIPVLNESFTAVIKVEVGDYTVQADKNFELNEPIIYNISPERIMPGEIIIIKGKGLRTVNDVFVYISYPWHSNQFIIKSQSDSLLELYNVTEAPTGVFDIYLRQLDREINSEKKLTIYLPEITSVSPTTVWLESIMEIRGTNLKKVSEILLNEDPTEIISKEDNLIKVKVLKPFVNAYIYGKIPNSRIIYFHTTLINSLKPFITSVTPLVALYGETLNITGDYFFPGITTYANGENTFSYVSKTKATNYVSWLLPTGAQSLSLLYEGYPISYNNSIDFVIPQIQIASITPTEIKKGTEIFIRFENLPPTITKDRVSQCLLERNPMTVTEVSSKGIRAVVNETFNCTEYPAIIIGIGGQTVYGERILHLNQPWKQFKFTEIPSYQSYALCATYDQSDNSLYAIAHPEYSNNKLTGILYKYSPGLNKWDMLNYMTYFDFEAPSKMFISGNDLYVAGYSYSEQAWNVCKYSKSTKKWSRLKGIPDYSSNAEHGGNLFTMVVNDRIFMGKRDWLFEYDAANNNWIERTKIPTGREILSPVTLTYNSKVLLGFPAYSTTNSEISQLFEYDPQANQWRNLGDHKTAFFYNSMGGSYSTSYNNKFYITGSSQIDGVTKLVEFDPATLNFREMIVPMDRADGAYLLFYYSNQLFLGSYKDVFYKIPVSDFSDIYQ